MPYFKLNILSKTVSRAQVGESLGAPSSLVGSLASPTWDSWGSSLRPIRPALEGITFLKVTGHSNMHPFPWLPTLINCVRAGKSELFMPSLKVVSLKPLVRAKHLSCGQHLYGEYYTLLGFHLILEPQNPFTGLYQSLSHCWYTELSTHN